jgi:hypothetical protein
MCSGPYLTAASLTRLLRSKHAATRSLACPPPAKLQPTNLQALTVLTNLRKICNHPTLYTPEGGPGGDSSGKHDDDEAQGFDPAESGGHSGEVCVATKRCAGWYAVMQLLLRLQARWRRWACCCTRAW